VNFDGNYRALGAIDVTPLRARLDMDAGAWAENDFRQRTFEPHRDTESILLVYDRDGRHLAPTKQAKFAEYDTLLAPIFARLRDEICAKGWCVRCLFARLPAGREIVEHVDKGFSLSESHRVHVPIVTNDAVLFRVGGEERHLRAGELWEINNLRPHAVENRGPEARVHLIVDWACVPTMR
jgi:hypothetical protein